MTTPALDLRSTGEWLVWSTGVRAPGRGAGDVAPDLFGAKPGLTAVLLYDNPNRDSRLEVVGGLGSKFAFMEVNARVFGLGAWRLWYLPGPESRPVMVDEGAGGQLPFFAMSTSRLVWTRAETTTTTSTSTLMSYEIASGEKKMLLSSPARTMQYWFPALDGEHLVFGSVEPSQDGLSDQRHAYYIDLSEATPSPVRLDSGTSASQPAIRGDIVVWKESDPDLNFLVAGHLVRHSLSSNTTEPLDLPTTAVTHGFTFPSIGTRFAVAWPNSDRSIYLADLEERTYPALIDLGPTNESPHDSVGRPHIVGDLLAYIYAPPSGDLELRWAQLR